jgi:hypothetical protein
VGCWLVWLLQVLAITVIVGFCSHQSPWPYFSRLLCVLKWGLLFKGRRELTTKGHSLFAGRDSSMHTLTALPPLSCTCAHTVTLLWLSGGWITAFTLTYCLGRFAFFWCSIKRAWRSSAQWRYIKLVLLLDIFSYPGEQSGLSSYLNLGLQYLSEILSFYWTCLFPFVNIWEAGGQICTRWSLDEMHPDK